jgi:hypothetical protein
MSRLLEAPPARRPSGHRKPPNYGFRRLVAVLVVISLGVLVWRSGIVGSLLGPEEPTGGAAAPPRETGEATSPGTGTGSRPTQASPSPGSPGVATPGPINTAFPGLTTFRGNATRSYYGEGPLPQSPEILWKYPRTGGMCSESNNEGVTKVWCGTGWTGQPNVVELPTGKVEVRFGAYDAHYHFINGTTGKRMREDVVTGDLAKGSATTDPDGYPLYYGGSRDNYLRIIAVDRPKPTVLWKLHSGSAPNPVWNDDWDGAPLVIGDYLLEGGENSWFYVVRLNRRYDGQGLVQVDPKIVMLVPGYDDRLFADIGGSRDVSIESSVAFHDGVAYFVNSGGLVQGWDVSDVLAGGADHRRVFRFWNGDDTDGSIVIDEEGYLYVGRHGEHGTARDNEIGDLMKLNPRKPNNPVVWSLHVTGGSAGGGGIWSTPAIYNGIVYVTTNYGEVYAVNQKTGRVHWRIDLPGPLWMSPVPIDGQLLVGDCQGVLHNYDISEPKQEPTELWSIQLEGCIESTPAVWNGTIYLGTRGGPMYAIGEA